MGGDSHFFISSNFGGIPPEVSGREKSRFVVIPVPYDHTTTFQSGTRKGPRAILEASAYVELYDEELRMEPVDAGIHTLDLLDVTVDPEETLYRIQSIVAEVVKADKIPVTLGGEHSITLAPVKALREKYP
ncbi:MAG: arginase family protein, partial [Nitrospirota bacterium]|nr:arginase family protein [Nitrospirota bacterium]